jgi:predicted amidophosphoribosyltransferase
MIQNTPPLCNRCKKQLAMTSSEVCAECYSKISLEMAQTIWEEEDERTKMPLSLRP